MNECRTLIGLLLLVGCTKLTDPGLPPGAPAPDDPALALPALVLRVDEAAFEEMNYRHGEEIELTARVDFYRAGAQVLTGEAAEIEVKGGVSAAYPLKSLGIKFDEAVDNADRQVLDPPVVRARHRLEELRVVRLRNAGNDYYGAQLKDLAYTRLALRAGLDVDPMYGEPCLLYLNDRFYGLMRLRSEGNTRGMAGLNGVKKRDITLAKVSWEKHLEYKDGDTVRLDAFFKAVRWRDTSYLRRHLDIDQFIDYCAFEGFIGNEDWPNNNVRFYAVNDGPFRCVLYDVDLAVYRKPDWPPVDLITYDRFVNPLRDIFLAFYEQPAFRSRFDDRLAELLADPALRPEAFNAEVDRLAGAMRPYMPLQVAAWQDPSGLVAWEIALEELRERYALRYRALTGR